MGSTAGNAPLGLWVREGSGGALATLASREPISQETCPDANSDDLLFAE